MAASRTIRLNSWLIQEEWTQAPVHYRMWVLTYPTVAIGWSHQRTLGGTMKVAKKFFSKRHPFSSVSGVWLLVAGVVLMLLAAIGDWTEFGPYPSSPPRQSERFDPGLIKVIDSYPSLLREARHLQVDNDSPEVTMNRLYGLVVDRFTHREASHTLFSNWLAFGLGFLHPGFSHIWSVDLMVRKGHSLLCDQSSYLLLRLAHDHGFRVRHVGLNGHVVMEAWYDGDWHLYDPDLEVVPVDSQGRVLSVEKLSHEKGLLQAYYGRHEMVEIVGSLQDDNYVSYPKGARFTWQAELLSRLEPVMQVMKYLFPVIMILFGIRLLLRQLY